MSNSYNLTAAVEKNNVKFDDTYIDIINSARIDISVGRNSAERDKKLKAIEKIIGGTVVYDGQKDEFYLKIGNSRQEFNLVAEGIRKMALLWQLVKNGTLEKGSVLFWDEPEANINPLYLSIITDMLLELQRDGVQIFISTHDYVLAKYFEIHRREEDSVLFHSVSYDEKRNLEYSCNGRFEDLKNNLIIKSFNELLDEIYNS
ncbi:MAG: AAA family ATPase [Eisenbergiella massiliensis]